jgi:hypothetical protein
MFLDGEDAGSLLEDLERAMRLIWVKVGGLWPVNTAVGSGASTCSGSSRDATTCRS